MTDRYTYPQLDVSRSVPANYPINDNGELSSYPVVCSPAASEADKDWMGEEELLLGHTEEKDREDYGSSNHLNEAALARERLVRRKRRRRRGGRRLESTTVASISSITKLLGNSESSDEEQPPEVQMIYRRSKKDLFKLIMIPVLYILLMGVAVVYAFYTIEGLVESYANKVRSIQVINVGARFEPVGIVIFPEFSNFSHCEYRYYDDLSPHPRTPPESCKGYQIPYACSIENITFKSESLDINRTALVVEGPTLVACKESVMLRFDMNTSVREFSAVEYILFRDYKSFQKFTEEEKRKFLERLDMRESMYTFPAGFRTWVKLAYSVRVDFDSKRNTTDFNVEDNYAAYNDAPVDGVFPMEVLFEWKDNSYEYIQEIVSTTAWSAFGSLCGVFITLVKAGEFCRMWLRRIRRDRQKKMEHLSRLRLEQDKLMAEYNRKQEEKRESKMKRSLERSRAIGTGIRVE